MGQLANFPNTAPDTFTVAIFGNKSNYRLMESHVRL